MTRPFSRRILLEFPGYIGKGTMGKQLLDKKAHSEDQYLARLYRLQVQELEDYAFFLSDTDGQIIKWNKGVQVAFGYKEEEFVGQNLRVIFTEEDRVSGPHMTRTIVEFRKTLS